MNNTPKLIVMLTYNDKTAADAAEIFAECENSSAQYWGFKEEDLPLPQMKELYAHMKRGGKTTVLEVVAYTEDKCLEGAQMAVECGCDILMGTIYSDKVLALCNEHGIKYMPFVGDVYDRPSILAGDIDEMIAAANDHIRRGAYGIDLLAYRYTGDHSELIRHFTKEVGAPVCIAGSVNCNERLDEIRSAAPWGFMIGSAFFNKDFGNSFPEQIEKVLDYVKEPAYV